LKVFGFGLDGGTLDLLVPWFDEGKLPTLRRLHEEGARARLVSTIPYLSPPAWASFFTGKNPGKHGVYDFIEHRPASYELRFCNGSTVRARTLWRILSEAGKRVGVINVPMTYPPEPVNGFLISGMECPGTQARYTHPPELARTLRKRLGEYNMHGDYYTPAGPEVYLKSVFETIDNQVAAADFLLAENELDFFFFCFGSTDRIQHFFWKFIDPSHPLYREDEARRFGDSIYQVYAAVDRSIERLLGRVPEDAAILVMSDHGAGGYSKIVYLDRWLEREGFLAYKGSGGAGGRLRAAGKRAYVELRKYLPRAAKDFLKSRLASVRQSIESSLLVSHIDWPRTRAFSLGIEATHVYVNRKDRFPQGTVEPGAEYDSVCDEIRRRLLELVDPETGERIVERVFRKQELYSGPAIEQAADLFVVWKGDVYITRRSYGPERGGAGGAVVDGNLRYGEIGELMSLEQTGTHRRDGIFMLRRPGVVKPVALDRPDLVDLAPTILHLMGQPVPDDMDGRVLTEAFEEAYLRDHPVRTVSAGDGDRPSGRSEFDAEDERQLHDRLSKLGYIE
jgi:predicted AlkP superfamily phosphohydrolase/phosphomutase